MPARAWVALAAALAAPAIADPDLHGTYRLQGRARVDARPFPATDEEVHADAVLSPGPRAGQVRIHLTGQGLACELVASLDGAGVLTLAPGQRCSADLAGGETEGHVEARLASGAGSLRGEVLALELDVALTGSVRARAGGTLDAIGQVLSLPGTRGSAVPVTGTAHGQARGTRDHSRTAE